METFENHETTQLEHASVCVYMKAAIAQQRKVATPTGRHLTSMGQLPHKGRTGRVLAGFALAASMSSGCDNVENREIRSESEDRGSSSDSNICNYLEILDYRINYDELCGAIGGVYYEGRGYCGGMADPDLIYDWCDVGNHFPPWADDFSRKTEMDPGTGMARCFINNNGHTGDYVDVYAPLTDFCPEYSDIAGIELKRVQGEEPDHEISCFYEPIVSTDDLPCSG